MMQRWRRGGLAAGLASLLLGACAFPAQMGGMAVDHNRMVAQSTDEMTLLNIVRASHRFPLHFTAITEVNGSISAGANANLSVDLDPRVDPRSTGLGGSVSASPSFRASVLATEEFQRGIQAPLAPELIAYYLDEGWRDALLMALVVERVDIFEPGGRSPAMPAIVNDEAADSAFHRLLCSYEMVSAPSATALPLATFGQLLDMDGLEGAPARRAEIASFLDLIGEDGVNLSGETLLLEGSSNIVQLRLREKSRCAGVAADPALAGKVLRPRFRSTLGLIYFLGEYQRSRAEKGANAVYRVPHCDAECSPESVEARPLIVIEEGSGSALVATSFNGERYYISSDEARGYGDDRQDTARSMQVLALIQQLINLQKSASQLPSSLTVTSVN